LFFWDKLLIENGQRISEKRKELIDFANQYFETLKGFGDFRLEYDKSIISPQRLEKYAREEVAAGVTLVGPHRDDIQFELEDRNLHTFGSRGEQRMAIFNLKLAELEFVSEKTAARPVLLLDDIFSELDQEHRSQIIRVIPKQQTIITATDRRLFDKRLYQKAETIFL
jgi:DNA replication and repair protein RecF